MGSICVGAQGLDKARLGRRQQFREHGEITAADGCKPERSVHVDPDDVPARGEPQLALARQQNIPGFMLMPADQSVLAVGAEPSVGSVLTSGAGQSVIATGVAVFGPSALLEVPAAESPDPFFAAFNSTWRSVNSWKNRSPTG